MTYSSRRVGLWRKHGRTIDLPALLLSVVVTACGAVAAAWWYAVSWQDITSSGFAGLFVFVFMFAVFLGLPAYFVVVLLRGRGRTDLSQRP